MELDVEKAKEIYGEDSLVVDDEIDVYENGKTLDCPNCGAGTGLPKRQVTYKCYECGKLIVDVKYDKREDEEPISSGTEGQMKIGDFA